MTSVGESSAAAQPGRNVFSRLALVLTSPGLAYAEVAARPKVLGAFAVVIGITVLCQFLFLSTSVGQQVLIDQQIKGMESFGMTVTPEIEQRLQSRAGTNRYTTAASQIVFIPIVSAVIAALLLGIFNATSELSSTFKHVLAVLAHSGAVTVVQQLVLTPLSYLLGEFASVTRLTVFFPMLDSDGFLAHLFAWVELFTIWWLVSLAIGIAVLYRRPTRGVTITILSIYAGLAIVISLVQAAF